MPRGSSAFARRMSSFQNVLPPSMIVSPATRRPDETRHRRLGELATLPVFFKLHGKRAVVSGGSDTAAWKVELLAAAGAEVHVFSPAPGERLRELEAEDPRLQIHLRAIEPADFAGAAMALADAADEDAAARFHAQAKAAGVPVNVIDAPQWCDF